MSQHVRASCARTAWHGSLRRRRGFSGGGGGGDARMDYAVLRMGRLRKRSGVLRVQHEKNYVLTLQVRLHRFPCLWMLNCTQFASDEDGT
jgi:hypothetical protein